MGNGERKMNRYDIVFMGHLSTSTIVPFEAPPFINRGGPVIFCSMAASCLQKKLAVVTICSKSEEELTAPLKAAGIDVLKISGETYQCRLVQPTPNVDERHMFFTQRAEYFRIEDLPSFEPCLIHLGGIGGDGYEFPLELMHGLKERGFRLSVDVQSFIWKWDEQAQVVKPKDVLEKKEILSIADFVKLDVNEAKALTGTNNIQEQAVILENMGSAEIIITSSNGALVQKKGKALFAKFNNENISGRLGRGDTFTGAYLTRRLDHSIEDSLKFAAALASIKMESPGPFKGSLEDVIERMNTP